jgi:hypothetical protein
MVEKIRTNRSDAQAVTCPECGAASEEPCRRDVPSHAARHASAVALGAPRIDRGAPDGAPDEPAAPRWET